MKKHTITPNQVYGRHSLILSSASSVISGNKTLEIISIITSSGIDSYYKITTNNTDGLTEITTGDLQEAIKEYNKH